MTVRIRAIRKTSGIARITERIQNAAKPMREIADLLHAEVLEAFRTESDPWGSPWAELKPSTIAKRVKRLGAVGGFGARKLQDRGFLESGLLPSSTAKAAYVKATGPASAYAAVHQFGNPQNRFPNTAMGAPAPIPARPFLPIRMEGGRPVTRLPEAVLEDIRDIFRRHLRGE